MANIEQINGKRGPSFRITVSSGYDKDGKKIRHRLNWKPEPNMTERQIEKAVHRAASDFERSIEQGYQIDNRQTFEQYAAYVLDLKKRTGLKQRTFERYEGLLLRILPAIGQLKLTDLRPQHLNSFYTALSKEGIRGGTARAMPKVDVAATLKRQKLSKTAVATQAGVAASTVSSVCRGNRVRLEQATRIAAVLGKPVPALFTVEQDTTPLADKTVLEYHRLIRTILAQAEKEMLVPYNAAAKATPPKVARHSVNYFQPEQIGSILDALEKEPIKWRLFVHLLIVTGCRRGEIAGLKWDKLDWEHQLVKIDTSLLYSQKIGVYESTTKTEDIRNLNLAIETMTLLRQYRLHQMELRLKNGDRWQETSYVFTKDNGTPMNPDSVTAWLRDFSKRHALPHINPHAFRHTVASVLIANGTDVVTVSKQLGHANVNTTETFYSHMIDERKAQAAECIANVMLRRKA